MKPLIRVIPLLYIKGPNLVQSVQREGLRVLGDPCAYARYYYEEFGADEIIYMDVVASLYLRNNLTEILSYAVADVFVPVGAGGGVRSVSDARSLLLAGADKVVVNTAATQRPQLIRELADVLGCQSVVVHIDAKQCGSHWEAMRDCAREKTGRDVMRWVEEVVTLGAGEILLLSVDKDGTGSGFDLPLIHAVASVCTVPLIAAGGCGTPQHAVEAVQAGADAVAISSFLHYGAMPHLAVTGAQEGNTEFLRGTRGVPRFGGTIQDIKQALAQAGYPVRATDQPAAVA